LEDNSNIGIRISNNFNIISRKLKGFESIELPENNSISIHKKHIKYGEELNKIKNLTPIFMYIYGHNFCKDVKVKTKLNASSDINLNADLNAICDENEKDPYYFSFEEHQTTYLKLKDFLFAPSIKISDIVYILIALILGLAEAINIGITNFDLSKVIVYDIGNEYERTLMRSPSKTLLLGNSNSDNNNLKYNCQYLPFVIDFTSCEPYKLNKSDSRDQIKQINKIILPILKDIPSDNIYRPLRRLREVIENVYTASTKTTMGKPWKEIIYIMLNEFLVLYIMNDFKIVDKYD
jgi:hypothetical protein